MSDPRQQSWLPDLCRLPRLGAMLGLSELVVVVVALAPDGSRQWGLSDFLSASGLALWLALAVTVTLCAARQPLSRLPEALGTVVVVAAAALIAAICTGIVHALYDALGTSGFTHDVGFWRFTLGCATVTALIVALALRYFYVADRWSAQTVANARAQADALQARIRPHFLFNSMNLIASLVRRDPVVAERAVLDLSDLFRAALGAGEGDSTLQAECELAEAYLSIESLRVGERLQVQWQREEPLPWSLPMPRLVLQPLVENAVLHGISRLPAGGTIVISLRCENNQLRITVRNPAPDPQARALPLAHGAGHAQRNIAHRLAWRYGPGARMTGDWNDGYYACDITVPLP
ncbi:sensor histidine kinase [Stenotrophomonas oahuensis]|uniref:Histidine kinase n=1 Tax=Stenotrophomonas oahuensis TaxID=3003271 RepID=A0ABY9YTM1_9GAMM|nr:histidine kinase [Stenotrophomonas sp. A5586]WNH53549.1 histidine kinase [Stenotrophomonas sp. A5586]